MLSSQISEAIVKISAKGIEAVQAQFAKLSTITARAKAQLDNTAKAVDRVGSAARSSFSSASSTILKFAAAASPADAMRLEAAYGRLSVQIGSLFLPVIRKATELVNQLTEALRKLTPEQREQIGTYAKWALGILAVVGAATQLLPILSSLVGGIGAVGAAVKSLFALVGVGGTLLTGWGAVILAIVAALGAFAAVSVMAAGKTDSITKSATKVWQTFKGLAGTVQTALTPIFAAFGGIIAGVFERAGNVVGKWAALVTRVWAEVGNIIQSVTPELEALADEFLTLSDEVMSAIAPLADYFYTTLAEGIKQLAPVVKSVMGGLVSFIKEAVKELRIMARVLGELASDPTKALDLEGTVKTARMEVERNDRKRKEEKDAGAGDFGAPDKPRSATPQSIYKAEFTGISDVFRKAQTAALGESKEMAMHRERIELQKQEIQVNAETRDAVKGLQVGLR